MCAATSKSAATLWRAVLSTIIAKQIFIFTRRRTEQESRFQLVEGMRTASDIGEATNQRRLSTSYRTTRKRKKRKTVPEPSVRHGEALVLHALGEHLVEVGDMSLVPNRQSVPHNPPDAPADRRTTYGI